ncbi:zinc finger protein 219 [Platysternon megacephalum]|uniref:Zinc finger protein 219 n=1 Tax=Platysternon megacephalum TaxID=55544 RepID=A0A4D9DN88_9SAUR|nr:zinc finger protein 219 [Platysternon megacephalum]
MRSPRNEQRRRRQSRTVCSDSAAEQSREACRGNVTDPGVLVETDSGQPPADSFSHYLSIPDSTAVMFACSPGYGAFLNPLGSMFLQTLLEFLEGDERHLELARLMTRISWKVAFHCEAKGTHKGEKEMPCFVTNMVREVYPFSTQTSENSDLAGGSHQLLSNSFRSAVHGQ